MLLGQLIFASRLTLCLFRYFAVLSCYHENRG